MRCQYCNKRLGVIQLLKGESFCSAEHRELNFGLSFERLRDSVAEFTPDSITPELLKTKAELAQARAEQSLANAVEPVQPQVPREPTQQTTSVAELHARLAKEQSTAVEVAAPAEIASPVETVPQIVERTVGPDLPEAPFLLELPFPRIQPALRPKSYGAQPMASAVQRPVSPIPVQEPLIRSAPSLVLDVSPAPSSSTVAPAGSQATWRSVPQGYPPVVVSASATLVL